MTEVIQGYDIDELLMIKDKYMEHYKKQGIRLKKYFQSEKGKKALKKAQHKYYLKKKALKALL